MIVGKKLYRRFTLYHHDRTDFGKHVRVSITINRTGLKQVERLSVEDGFNIIDQSRTVSANRTARAIACIHGAMQNQCFINPPQSYSMSPAAWLIIQNLSPAWNGSREGRIINQRAKHVAEQRDRVVCYWCDDSYTVECFINSRV